MQSKPGLQALVLLGIVAAHLGNADTAAVHHCSDVTARRSTNVTLMLLGVVASHLRDAHAAAVGFRVWCNTGE